MIAAQVTPIFILQGIVAAVLYGAVLWVAIAFYVYRDACRRSTSKGFRFVAVIFGCVPPFLGPLIYLVIRPPMTLEEEQILRWESEVQTDQNGLEAIPSVCPACGKTVESEFIMCPACKTQYARRCTKCDRAIKLGWSCCPYCATEVETRPPARSRKKRVAVS